MRDDPSSPQDTAVHEFLRKYPDVVPHVDRVRAEKRAGTRPLPSANLDLRGPTPMPDYRAELLDEIAKLVDEDLCGRSNMCEQFAGLLTLALRKLGVGAQPRVASASTSRTVLARYLQKDGEWFAWPRHVWVVAAGNVLIDGNVDSTVENPATRGMVNVKAYWGPANQVPDDRRLPPGKHDEAPLADHDVRRWWPALEGEMKRRGWVA